jgi:hypothetical protein
MRDADCAKNTENALKKYSAEKIVKNTNQKHNIPPDLKSRMLDKQKIIYYNLRVGFYVLLLYFLLATRKVAKLN